ncbi:Mg-protoporphyrin IX methyl transferase [archaeon BMS3Abin16]|nr:Mg-protoporphyrin IX methyl transferase [archaeon BMS3Abin16]HDY74419.1 class I SAM-dependent methyltransferase [Euryarchaeota archaeon]
MPHGQVNKTLVKLIFEEPVDGYTILDVGCGSGALSFIVAEKAKSVVGIDISEKAINAAKLRAQDNTSFHVLDAENTDLTVLGEIDMIVSHLCISDKIVENSYHGLPKKGRFVFACFHSDHLIEGGRRSRFSYSVGEMRCVLEKTGFTVEYLGVESEKIPFKNMDEAAAVIGLRRAEKWRSDGRLQNIQRYVESGGKHLTKSILRGKAQKNRKA